eukprot:Nk52_evm23s243 gene=Nk52_evmTU23s243
MKSTILNHRKEGLFLSFPSFSIIRFLLFVAAVLIILPTALHAQVVVVEEVVESAGDILAKQGEYKKAVESFSKALEVRPGDKNCLVARSKCLLNIGDNDAALADAETALKDDKEYNKGLFQKAEALYAKGDFEYALVYYHRGHKLRPELNEFRLGIQKASEAIDNSIGSKDSYGWKGRGKKTSKDSGKGDSSSKQKSSGAGADRRGGSRGQGNAAGAGGRGRNAVGSNAVGKGAKDDSNSKQLLGEMYADKEYLETLLADQEIAVDGNQKIRELITSGLSFLDARTEFWRQQKPMYARRNEQRRKFRKASMLKAKHDLAQARRADMGTKSRSKVQTTQFILETLENINKALDDDEPELSLKYSKAFLKKVTDMDIEDKHHILGNLYSSMGNAYFELNSFQQAAMYHQKDFDLAKQYTVPSALSRALGNLGRTHASMGEYQKAITVWKQKLEMKNAPPDAKEKAWLNHDIGRCYLELDMGSKALECGVQAVKDAMDAQDDRWLLNSHVLIGQANTKLESHSKALEAYKRALETAQKLEDDQAVNGLETVMAEVSARVEAGGEEPAQAAEETKAEEEPTATEGETEAETEATATEQETAEETGTDAE